MARSLKKGPYIHYKLEKKVLANVESGKNTVIKTWSRGQCLLYLNATNLVCNQTHFARRSWAIIKYSPKEASLRLEKLLLSAIANWQAKNEGANLEEAGLIVQEISVDSGRMLKRIQAAPQGRAHRIRKRSNHVTLIVGSKES